MTEYLSLEDSQSLAESFGLYVRDLGLLAGALARPQASAFGEDAYPDLSNKIAALIDGINRSHPMLDGNKRLSWICAVAMAEVNNMDLAATQDEIVTTIMGVAAGQLSLDELGIWVAEHIRGFDG